MKKRQEWQKKIEEDLRPFDLSPYVRTFLHGYCLSLMDLGKAETILAMHGYLESDLIKLRGHLTEKQN